MGKVKILKRMQQFYSHLPNFTLVSAAAAAAALQVKVVSEHTLIIKGCGLLSCQLSASVRDFSDFSAIHSAISANDLQV